MPSFDDHFNALTKVRPPEGWPDLGERGTRALGPPDRHRLRAGTALLAFVVAAAGFVFAIRASAWSGRKRRPRRFRTA
jgi:hypothetical protein